MTISEKISYDTINKSIDLNELLADKGFIIKTAMDNYNHDLIDCFYDKYMNIELFNRKQVIGYLIMSLELVGLYDDKIIETIAAMDRSFGYEDKEYAEKYYNKSIESYKDNNLK